MVKRRLLFLLFWCSASILFSQNKADSIITEVLRYRELYGEYVREYDAQVYIKGNTQLKKKNLLSRYAPDFLYWDKKSNNSFVEAIVDVHFEAPNHFTQEIKAINGNRLNVHDIQDRLMQFLNVNIYNPSIFNGQVLLPDIKTIFHYYRFEYVASSDTLGYTIHQIRIIPKIKSQKLISGFFYIVNGLWTICRFDIHGKWEWFDFRIETEFSLHPKNFLLPLHSQVTFHLNLLGNETENHYYSHFTYKDIQFYTANIYPKTINYDLSNYFNVHTDSVPFTKDSLFWKNNRPVPLSAYEQSLLKKRSKPQPPNFFTALAQQSWNLAKGLIIPKQFEYNQTEFTYSGLINPLKLAYSQLDGIVYWQQVKMYRQYDNGQEFRFRPNLGMVLKRKELYFGTPVSWLFAPEKFGEVAFTLGNRNQSYNSTMIEQINQAIADSLHFDDFQLKYYRHFHTHLEAKYELLNGLLLYGGIHYDWYIPVKAKNESADLRNNIQDDDIIDLVRNCYRTFAPVVGLRWTPGQFYRINGKRKEYLHSRFPTFFVEYARGIKHVLNSNSNYERIEIDIQQKLPLGLMHSFHYYLGAGWFTNTRSVYFADFNNFQKQHIPQSWDDPIGGTFHLLNGDWYNASKSYIQAHFMYESPFSVLQFFRHITTDIVNERIYFSQLYMPRSVHIPIPDSRMRHYTEIGYGVGNFIGNAGVFVSFRNWKFESVGAKFAFELGL